MLILEKDYLAISKKLLDIAHNDGIEKISVKLVIKKEDTVLLLKRVKNDHFPDLYELPGGGLNENEDIFSGARRELFEETGLIIKKFISQLEIINFNTNSNQKKCRQYAFIILPIKKDIILNPNEHSEYKWVSSAELENLYIFPKIKTMIRKVLLE